MNNYELDSSKLFNANLEASLAALAAAWGVSADTSPAIEDVRKAAHFNVVGRTNLRLVRLVNHSPFEEHRAFFEGLTAADYSPHLYGTNIKQDTPAYAQAKKLLKDFAHYVGRTVIREQDAKLSAARTKDPAWIESGLIPSDNGIIVTDTGLSHEEIDWGAPTIPADLPQDELSKLRDEKSRMTEIINGASPSDVRLYLKNTLRPRFVEVLDELKSRREKYTNQTSFELREGALIDFKGSLITTMQHALERMVTPIVTKQAEIAPYPILVTNDDDVAVVAPTVITTAKKLNPTQVDEKLKALQTRINGYVDTLSGASLKKFHDSHLLPKQSLLLEEIFELASKGDNPEMLHIKERHLELIDAGISVTKHKINVEAAAALETRVAIQKAAATTMSLATPGQTAAERRKAWEDSLPVLTDVITFPLQTSRDVSNATTVPFQEVKAEPKKSTSWLKRAAVAAAWVVGSVAVGLGGAFLGVAGKIAYQDHVRDSKIAAAATEQFNQAAESSPAQRAVDLAKETGYYSPLTEKTVAAEPVAVAKADITPAPEVKVAKDPAPVKQAKARADFKPAADDYKVTYEPLVAKSFDIATSISGLDTWSRACDYLKAQGTTVENGVCPK